MSDVIPEEIVHLDFTPGAEGDQAVEAKEEPEKAKYCGCWIYHPTSNEEIRCRGKAIYEITISGKACGHPDFTVLVCQGCWTDIDSGTRAAWYCGRCRNHGRSIRYVIKKHLSAWRRL